MAKRRGQQQQPATTGPASQQRSVTVSQTASISMGPLPKPDDLARYEEIVPGAARAIIEMAQQQAGHRRELEHAVIFGDSRRSYLGLLLGFIVAMTLLVGAIVLGLNGHDAAAIALGTVDVASLLVAFVTGTISRRGEREAKGQAIGR